MKYVALLSGGKDSCFNLLHCARNGHELVVAASLAPEEGKDEIDSYMYQTVGQDAIELVAQALEVPLYRATISGSAVNQGSEYGARKAGLKGVDGDETEDLFELLSVVKSNFPDIQGVSVGAILSNYQRVRVEHVCRRLSLTPLCYLWQRDQAELLTEMTEAGLEAIIIKVAGAGLVPKHLGKTLTELRPTLMKLHDLYDLHPCGEGGEYETLTLDCPLFTRKIHLLDTETVIHSDNDFATVAYLRIRNAVLIPKDGDTKAGPRIPQLLQGRFSEVQNRITESIEPEEAFPNLISPVAAQMPELQSISKQVGPWVAIGNIQRTSTVELSIEAEVQECFRSLEDHLKKYSLDLSHCANINVFLSSIDLFATVNQVYATFFGSSPPARACVAVDLPPPTRIRLDCIAYDERHNTDRQALHVQGLSYWAPANIGPYSQAITIKKQRIFISGQIGLIPSSLSLPSPQSLAQETALSCQHVDRVVTALENNASGQWKGHAQLAIYWLQSAPDLHLVRSACDGSEVVAAPTLLVVVAGLPKGALVEKQVLLHTGRFEVKDEYGELEVNTQLPTFQEGSITGPNGARVQWESSHFNDNGSACTVVYMKATLDETVFVDLQTRLKDVLRDIISIRWFYRPSNVSPRTYMFCALPELNTDGSVELPQFIAKSDLPTTPIPCRYIANRSTDNWDHAICIVSK